MAESLIPPTFLFRFASPLLYRESVVSSGPAGLDESYRLPSFGELEGKPIFADLRGAWCEEGLAFWMRVRGKKQQPWCRVSRLEDSDGLHFWIDTRSTQTVHRATRFCHRFVFMPMGGGRNLEQAAGEMVLINRARENPKPPPAGTVRVRSEKRIDGYLLEVVLEAAALTGFDPREQPRLGFSYAVVDRELGWQTFTVGRELPFEEDPSLWGILELTK